MSDNQIIKAEKDFSKDADKLIPEAENLAQVYYSDYAGLDPCTNQRAFRPTSKAPSTSFLSWRSKHVKLVRLQLYMARELNKANSHPISPQPHVSSQPLSHYAKITTIGACSTSRYCLFQRSMGSSSRRSQRWCKLSWDFWTQPQVRTPSYRR